MNSDMRRGLGVGDLRAGKGAPSGQPDACVACAGWPCQQSRLADRVVGAQTMTGTAAAGSLRLSVAPVQPRDRLRAQLNAIQSGEIAPICR